jgi:hypothetical protein
MADYDWFDRTDDMERHFNAQRLRGMGFHPVWSTHGVAPEYYQCRRGCGTLVWDPEAHMKNVCTIFEPVVGE